VKRSRNIRPASDDSGAAAVEFALIAPFLLLGLLGMFDLSYNMYTSTLLQGAIQKTARDSTIEGAGSSNSKLDQRVANVVHDIAPSAALEFSRQSYSSYSAIGKAEDFSDINKNDICDDGEPYEDANGNSSWDADRGKDGTGSARDAVLYEVTATYPRAFPFYKLIGAPETFTLQATTILRNQPYSNDAVPVVVRNCT
jgi:Flp pilus assembly pilin Flp